MENKAQSEITNYLEYVISPKINSEKKTHDLVDKLLAENKGCAAVCVDPAYIDTAGIALGDSDICISTYIKGSTYCEVKMLECSMAIENGADEIEIMLNVGEITENEAEKVRSEMEVLKREIEDDAILKIDICANIFPLPVVEMSTVIAIQAGADFIVVNTDSEEPSDEKIKVVCDVIKSYYEATSKMIGIKFSGCSSVEEVLNCFVLTENCLGKQWITPDLFRIETMA